jgi:CubicO group peptidase (beta-lactamase class C family)
MKHVHKEPGLVHLQQVFDSIDRFAEQLMHAAHIPGLAIGLTDREQLLRVSTYGVADIAAHLSVTPETLFQIGSLGKPFTSIALLQLRDEGIMDLHAPVTQYLPWFEVQSVYPPITVHHVMNHTAGLIRGTDVAPHGLYESWALRTSKTRTPPGAYFWYSNIGYKTLGFLLEELTGQSLPEVIQSRVLDPLGMTQTYPAVTHETRPKTAIAYCGMYDDRPEHPSHSLVPAIWAEYGTGDGCQVSTVGDMAIYLRMLLNRGQGRTSRIMSEESFDLMTLHGIWTGGDYYGYGLATYPLEGRSYIGHGGGNAGYRSAIVVDMEAGLGVVFLLNVWGETDPIVNAATDVLTVLRAAQHGMELPPLPHAPDPSHIANAAEYAGVYRAGNRVLRLTSEEGKLLLTYNEQVVVLERRAADRFYVGHPELDLFLLEFQRHDDGEVVEAFHGPDWYVNERYAGPEQFTSPERWEAYTGHYRARNPELSNFRVALRQGGLVLLIPWGGAEPLVACDDGSFRIGADENSPETLRFDAVVGGRALLAEYSGCPYYRAFTP